jgi:hypothetical protein
MTNPQTTGTAGTGTAIVPVHQRQAVLVQPPDAMTMAQQFYESKFFSDIKSAAQALVKIEYGRELGIGPAAAMLGVHIIKDKPSPSAGLMAALIKGSGKYDYKVKRWDNEACVLTFVENGKVVGESSFTMQDAVTAGATTGTNSHTWKAYPRNMLFARALSNGARVYCPDVFLGPVYVAEELGVAVNEDGEILDVTPAAQLQQPTEPRPIRAVESPQQQGIRRQDLRKKAGEHLKRLELSRPDQVDLMLALTRGVHAEELSDGGFAAFVADVLQIQTQDEAREIITEYRGVRALQSIDDTYYGEPEPEREPLLETLADANG